MIEVKQLTKFYGRTLAVDHVSFTVKEGDIFGFIGPNGAGKTTLIRTLATLLDPSDGTVMVDGHCVVNDPESVRRIIGYMPDNFGVYEGLTVWEYIDFFAMVYRVPGPMRRKIVDDVMELTDLGQIKDKLAATLSKGMKQRLCLAKTLVHNPKVLVLDEPASGLDPRARIEFRILLKELKAMGKTILLSSHILTELSDVCNSVGIIEKGKLIVSGEIDKIMASLAPSRVLRIEVVERPDEAAAILKGIQHVMNVEPVDHAVRIHYQGEKSGIADLVEALVRQQIRITGVHEEKSDLEDLFMKLTKGELA